MQRDLGEAGILVYGDRAIGLRRSPCMPHGRIGRLSQKDIRLAMIEKPRVLLRSLFDAAVAAADPACVLAQYLPLPPKGRTIVIGAGKAAAAMARAFEAAWPADYSGLVVTRYGYSIPTQKIT